MTLVNDAGFGGLGGGDPGIVADCIICRKGIAGNGLGIMIKR